MPPRRRKNTMLSFIQYSIIVLLVVALIAAGAFFMFLHQNPVKDKMPEDTSSDTLPEETVETPETSTIPEQTVPETEKIEEPVVPGINVDDYTRIDVPKSDVHKGNLIFVSSNYKAVPPAQDQLVSLMSNKTASYGLGSNTMLIHKNVMADTNRLLDDFAAISGKTDIAIWTSYRDEARQNQVYTDHVNRYGEAKANTLVAKGGESDHNTGLGIILRVFTGGLSYQLFEREGYEWIEENCYKYGFVERYPDDKIDKTGLDYSSTVYLRYVGVPHSEIMKSNNYCLEEYLTMIKEYTFGNAHYSYTDGDGAVYEIYYVRADGDGDTVNIPVPKSGEYTVSGDNMSGFIITVKK